MGRGKEKKPKQAKDEAVKTSNKYCCHMFCGVLICFYLYATYPGYIFVFILLYVIELFLSCIAVLNVTSDQRFLSRRQQLTFQFLPSSTLFLSAPLYEIFFVIASSDRRSLALAVTLLFFAVRQSVLTATSFAYSAGPADLVRRLASSSFRILRIVRASSFAATVILHGVGIVGFIGKSCP